MLRAILQWLKSYIPERLPQSGAAMEAWLVQVMALAGVPDADSYRQAIATSIMQLPELGNRRSKQFFIRVIQKRISAQLAYNIIDGIREKEKQQRVQDSKVQEAPATVVP